MVRGAVDGVVVLDVYVAGAASVSLAFPGGVGAPDATLSGEQSGPSPRGDTRREAVFVVPDRPDMAQPSANMRTTALFPMDLQSPGTFGICSLKLCHYYIAARIKYRPACMTPLPWDKVSH